MISAIIDIGSGSVGVAIVLLEKNKNPVIKYSDRRALRPERTNDPKKILSHSLDTLTAMVTNVQKNNTLGAPSRIFCFLSPHLIASQTRIISADFDKPTKVNPLMITDMVDQELAKAKNGVVIEKKIMTVKLNGYETGNLVNKTANNIEVAVLYSISSEEIQKAVKDVVAGVFHNDQVELHSFSFAFFSALRDLYKTEENFIFMDIGSEITDVALVKDGAILNQISFPSGKNALLSGNTSSAEWTALAKQIINALDPYVRLPEKIYILADGDVLLIFKNGLFSLGGKSDIIEMTGAELSKYCDARGSVGNDPFLLIAAIFVNKLLN